mmetsp:Transcript_27436/g.81733  ORF Transcript_27436/g.81733 Transcript_27436/m.81733 type:complete len:271 (-) Transcript_27436:1839-2651(-)
MAMTTMWLPRTSMEEGGSIGLLQISRALSGGPPQRVLSSSASCQESCFSSRISCSRFSESFTSSPQAASVRVCSDAAARTFFFSFSAASCTRMSSMKASCCSRLILPTSIEFMPTSSSASCLVMSASLRSPSEALLVARLCILRAILDEWESAMSRAFITQPGRPLAASRTSVSGRGGRTMPGMASAIPASLACSSISSSRMAALRSFSLVAEAKLPVFAASPENSISFRPDLTSMDHLKCWLRGICTTASRSVAMKMPLWNLFLTKPTL